METWTATRPPVAIIATSMIGPKQSQRGYPHNEFPMCCSPALTRTPIDKETETDDTTRAEQNKSVHPSRAERAVQYSRLQSTMDWGAPALMSSVADPSMRDLCCFGAGIAGNVFAFVLFISPLPTFRRIVRNRSTEQFSAMPYIYSLLNCLICMWYGLPFVSYGVVLVATVNSIGAAFQLAYTAVFIAFADAKERLKVSSLLAAVFVVFGLIMYVSLALLDHQTRQMFVGYLSVASLIFMFASPLSIIIPNGIGTILGIIQLLLYAYFRKGSREEAKLPLLVTHT
nr:unnamed protein product [Digitaria exilis]CAB3477307.1 unnamed protein product [Digitaria exilis]CAB3477309.1 unnamed protein product [Digitaria exilis]